MPSARPSWMNTTTGPSMPTAHIASKGKVSSKGSPKQPTTVGGSQQHVAGKGKGKGYVMGKMRTKRSSKDLDLNEAVEAVSDARIRKVASGAGIKRMQAAFLKEVKWGMIYKDVKRVVEPACMIVGCDKRAIIKPQDMLRAIQSVSNPNPSNFYPTE